MFHRGEVWTTLCCGWTVIRREKTSALRWANLPQVLVTPF